MTDITRQQAHLLAQLARTIRPAWDERHTTDVIASITGRALADIATAVIRGAADPTIRTPNGILLDGPHWRRDTGGGETPEQRAQRIALQDRARQAMYASRGTAGTRVLEHQPYITAARQAILDARDRVAAGRAAAGQVIPGEIIPDEQESA